MLASSAGSRQWAAASTGGTGGGAACSGTGTMRQAAGRLASVLGRGSGSQARGVMGSGAYR